MSENTVVADSVVEAGPTVLVDDDAPDDDALLESLLVEEVSIDGMCGVY
jgi:mycofactocin precursor